MGISAIDALNLRMEETRFRASGTRGSVFLRTVAAAVSAAHFCNSRSAGKMPAGPTGPSRTGLRLPCYGDFFGEGDADAAAAGDAAGGVAGASAGLALSNSTSKIRVALGPISPPAPPGP